MPLDPESLQRLAASDRLVGKLVANGWPLTKAAYLHLLLYPMDNVQFPLSGDCLEQIPMGLEGADPRDAAGAVGRAERARGFREAGPPTKSHTQRARGVVPRGNRTS